jgi:stage II sporulation protein P
VQYIQIKKLVINLASVRGKRRSRRRARHGRGKVIAAAFLLLIGIGAVLLSKQAQAYFTEEVEPAYAGFYEIANAKLEKSESIPSEKVDISALKDLGTLRNKYYSVDKKTGMTADMFDIAKLMSTNVHIEGDELQPKVLIFHTHAHEMYADSKAGEGVVGAGELLKTTLEKEYGIKCIHVTDSFDTVDGELQILGAYERMEPRIKQILAENPSIEMVIDLHRDGVAENVRLVSEVEGEKCAKFMFFNGLCQKANSDGTLSPTEGLENPYVEDNLALSLKAQMQANELYPGLTRKIYLNAYRYSLHLKPMSMLIELGAQTNTEEEVQNSVKRLARVLYETSFG